MFTFFVSRHRAATVAVGLMVLACGVAQATPPPSADDAPGLGPPVSSSALGEMSGGTDTTTNGMTIDGTVSNTQTSHVSTGMNAIDSNSFQGAAGLPTVIQNTGNNVLIQNATIVNVRLIP
ncbi:hypothetical protein EC912_11120 [Luteibacter rhizovicinus]|uniref:Uncharacterized protein n=1 Tax=Luteibacter rhizovicinus TaxID=242606 RepID=A0A4R3YGN9_9GAMM|nr:hypothetical protein [Luteibacter rhizovicinus]TCV91427.1 hypothetical protein EC912_11120 [Luteibacter rhizovicinus]